MRRLSRLSSQSLALHSESVGRDGTWSLILAVRRPEQSTLSISRRASISICIVQRVRAEAALVYGLADAFGSLERLAPAEMIDVLALWAPSHPCGFVVSFDSLFADVFIAHPSLSHRFRALLLCGLNGLNALTFSLQSDDPRGF